MTRWISAAGLALLLAGEGFAQQFPTGPIGQPPPRRPAFSPYLNLNRGGTSPGINYFGIVRPQIETNRSLQMLQTEIQTLPQGTTPTTGTTATVIAGSTGHPVTFFNTSHYFGMMGGRTGTGASVGGIGTAAPGVGIGVGVGGGTQGFFPAIGAPRR